MLTETLLNTPLGKINIAEGPNNGPLLFLMHGFTNRWQMFTPILPHLIPNWHVVSYDHRGHGRSCHPAEGYTAHTYYQDVETIFAAKDDQPAFLLGHSMGGSMALWFTTHHPTQVKAVVIGDTSLDLPMHIEVMNNRRNVKLFSLRRRMAGHPVQDLTRRGVPQYQAEELSQLDPRVMDFHAEGRVDEFFAGVQPFNLAGFRCPILVTQADPARGGILQDAEIPADLSRYPNLSFQRFDCGHDLEIDKGIDSPFFQAALSFLMRHR